MIGKGMLSEKPGQVVICSTPESYARLSADLPEKFAVCQWEPASDGHEEFALLTGRRVVCIYPPSSNPGMLEMCLLAKPAELKAIQIALPDKFPTSALNWCALNAKIWPEPEQASQESEAHGQDSIPDSPRSSSPLAASHDASDLSNSAAPVADNDLVLIVDRITQRVAADPLNEPVGDLEPQDIGEPSSYVTDAPPADFEPVNGDDHAEPSSVWVKPLADSEEWPHPADIFGEMRPPEPFNPDLLPGVLGDFVTYASQLKGTDPGIAALTLIGCLSAWCHETFKLQVKTNDKSWREAARLWCLIEGSSSDGKSPGMSLASKPARDLEAIAGKEAAVALAKYASDKRMFDDNQADYEKAKRKGDVSAKQPAPVEKIEIDKRTFAECTIEGLRALLETTPKAFLLTQEASAWLANMGKFAGTKDSQVGERSQYLQAWDGGAHTILRASQAIHLDSWSLCIVAGATGSSLRASLGNSRLLGDGLIQRFIAVHVAEQQEDDDSPATHEAFQAAYDKVEAIFHRLRYMRPLNDAPLRLAPDGYEYFQAFMRRLKNHLGGIYSPACESMILKCRSHAPRLALVLHLADRAAHGQECNSGEYVSLETMRQACDIVENLIPHTIYFWDSVLGEGNREVAREIQTVCEIVACYCLDSGILSLVQLGNSWKNWKTKTTHEQQVILNGAQDLGWIVPNTGTAKLRAPGIYTSYKVNPRLRAIYDDHPAIIAARLRRKQTGEKFAEMRRASLERAAQQDRPLH